MKECNKKRVTFILRIILKEDFRMVYEFSTIEKDAVALDTEELNLAVMFGIDARAIG